MQKIFVSIFILLYLGLGVHYLPRVIAQGDTPSISSQLAIPDQTFEGTVTKVIEEKTIKPDGGIKDQLYQKLVLFVRSGVLKGKTITVENGLLPVAEVQRYTVGETVVINRTIDPNGKDFFLITDYVRRRELYLLFLIFLFVVIVIARWQGIASLLGMAVSFLIIFLYILPQILQGKNPILIAILGSFIIIPITFYLSHGLKKKTTVSVLATLLSLIITGILAYIFVGLTKLTGYAAEETSYLLAYHSETINVKNLLLAGIIIGGLGIFDDITISQASIVEELSQSHTHIQFSELYKRAMRVGHDHIASMVNTLILVYTGAALPLLLLFVGNPKPFSEIVNYEIIAEEIVKTLVASIGLILAVPIATFLAALVFKKE